MRADAKQEAHEYTDDEIKHLSQYFDILLEIDMAKIT